MNRIRENIATGCCIAACLITLASAQDYHWPTEAGTDLVATFADMRSRHYHAGLDISTNGGIGYPINAISGGYIERILVRTNKYGKTIYLRLKDGRLAVYAHLQKFTPDMDDLIATRQGVLNKYDLNLRFKPTDFPVLKGDIIGFTGDTGTISGPHLHFELRDKDNYPINPLTHGVTLPDDRLPLFRSLAVIPLGPGARAHGSSLPSVLPAREVKLGWFVLDDTVTVSGPVGLAIQAYDLVPDNRRFHTIYGISLSVDGYRQYAVQFDRFHFGEDHLMELERDYRLWRLENDDYHRLINGPHHDGLSFLLPGSDGVLDLEPGYHHFTVKIWDKNQNVAVLRGVLGNTPGSKLMASSEWSDDENGWIVTLEPSTRLRAYHVFFFSQRGRQVDTFSHRPEGPGKSLRFVVPKKRGRHRILQIIGIDRWGARLEPVHLSLIPIEEVTTERKFTLQMENGPGGVSFQVTSDLYLPEAPELVLITSHGAKRYQTSMVSPTAFLTPPIPLAQLDGITEAIIRVNLQPAYEVRVPIQGVLVSPEGRHQLSDPDNLLRLEFRPGTFYDSTLVWYTPVEIDPPDSGRFVIKPVKVGPLLAPYRGAVGLQMSVPPNRLLPRNAGIFYLDRKEGWTFMDPAGNASRENLIQTRAYRSLATSGEIYALIEESEPPVIKVLRPGQGATYAQQDFRLLRVLVEDSLAGIENEKAINLAVDGQELIFEYNTHRNSLRHSLKEALSPGEHQLTVRAIDRVGNVASDTVNFFIR